VTDRYQLLPRLSDDEYAALQDDIQQHGVLVPIVYDQHGNVLDGHHRLAIVRELGIETYPTEVREVADDDAARQIAWTLNLSRRHLTREQKRELIAAELDVRPGDSDRAIARRLRCSPSTVGSVRREVSNLDTSEAEGAVSPKLLEAARACDRATDRLAEALALDIPASTEPALLDTRLAEARQASINAGGEEHDVETLAALRATVLRGANDE
jgi:ParB-like chromosome segregation protein Spo0J